MLERAIKTCDSAILCMQRKQGRRGFLRDSAIGIAIITHADKIFRGIRELVNPNRELVCGDEGVEFFWNQSGKPIDRDVMLDAAVATFWAFQGITDFSRIPTFTTSQKENLCAALVKQVLPDFTFEDSVAAFRLLAEPKGFAIGLSEPGVKVFIPYNAALKLMPTSHVKYKEVVAKANGTIPIANYNTNLSAPMARLAAYRKSVLDGEVFFGSTTSNILYKDAEAIFTALPQEKKRAALKVLTNETLVSWFTYISAGDARDDNQPNPALKRFWPESGSYYDSETFIRTLSNLDPDRMMAILASLPSSRAQTARYVFATLEKYNMQGTKTIMLARSLSQIKPGNPLNEGLFNVLFAEAARDRPESAFQDAQFKSFIGALGDKITREQSAEFWKPLFTSLRYSLGNNDENVNWLGQALFDISRTDNRIPNKILAWINKENPAEHGFMVRTRNTDSEPFANRVLFDSCGVLIEKFFQEADKKPSERDRWEAKGAEVWENIFRNGDRVIAVALLSDHLPNSIARKLVDRILKDQSVSPQILLHTLILYNLERKPSVSASAISETISGLAEATKNEMFLAMLMPNQPEAAKALVEVVGAEPERRKRIDDLTKDLVANRAYGSMTLHKFYDDCWIIPLTPDRQLDYESRILLSFLQSDGNEIYKSFKFKVTGLDKFGRPTVKFISIDPKDKFDNLQSFGPKYVTTSKGGAILELSKIQQTVANLRDLEFVMDIPPAELPRYVNPEAQITMTTVDGVTTYTSEPIIWSLLPIAQWLGRINDPIFIRNLWNANYLSVIKRITGVKQDGKNSPATVEPFADQYSIPDGGVILDENGGWAHAICNVTPVASAQATQNANLQPYRAKFRLDEYARGVEIKMSDSDWFTIGISILGISYNQSKLVREVVNDLIKKSPKAAEIIIEMGLDGANNGINKLKSGVPNSIRNIIQKIKTTPQKIDELGKILEDFFAGNRSVLDPRTGPPVSGW